MMLQNTYRYIGCADVLYAASSWVTKTTHTCKWMTSSDRGPKSPKSKPKFDLKPKAGPKKVKN